MARRKPHQKEDETKNILNEWFNYVKKSTLPTVDEFATIFLGIPKNMLFNLRKNEILPEEDISIKDGKTLHPRTFKELFYFDVDDHIKNIKMPNGFEGEPQIVNLLIGLPKNHFFISLCPRLSEFKDVIVSLDSNNNYGLPTVQDIQKTGAFYPASPFSYGVTFEAMDVIEEVENKIAKVQTVKKEISLNIKLTHYLKKLLLAFFIFCVLCTAVSIILGGT